MLAVTVKNPGLYLLDFESSSQHELLVLLPDLDVVDFVLVVDHQGEGLVRLLPGAVPHQVRPILDETQDLKCLDHSVCVLGVWLLLHRVLINKFE